MEEKIVNRAAAMNESERLEFLNSFNVPENFYEGLTDIVVFGPTTVSPIMSIMGRGMPSVDTFFSIFSSMNSERTHEDLLLHQYLTLQTIQKILEEEKCKNGYTSP